MATIRRVVAFAALFLLIVVPHASADPVLITGGFINVPKDEGGLALITGTRGFAVGAGIDRLEGRVDPFICLPCAASAPLSVGANLSGSVFSPGFFTLDGVVYGDISHVDSPASLGFELFGVGITPPSQDQPVMFTAPFTLTGFINLPFPSPQQSVVGRGIATVTLMPELIGSGAPSQWFTSNVRYDFSDASAVPEPSTLALVSGGLLAIGRLARRGRQRRRRGTTNYVVITN